MHHIYHTEGLILGSGNFGEAGRYYVIFTRDLGMIYASAQGVRKMSSKLRFILQDFSYVKIDLVRGKDFWKITSASKTNELDGIIKNSENLKIYSNISKLLKRLLAGEEPNEELFRDLLAGLGVLEKLNNQEERLGLEAIIVLRILSNLGYIGDQKNLQGIIKSPFEHQLIFEAKKNRKKILVEINRALGETQL